MYALLSHERKGGIAINGQLTSSSDYASSSFFFHCGVDYAGPLIIRTSHLRAAKTTKRYVAVFVCLSTKAIHLEAVTDLSTNAFLAALKRFISRRGLCSELWSDHGTNFVGADREIRKHLPSQHKIIYDVT